MKRTDMRKVPRSPHRVDSFIECQAFRYTTWVKITQADSIGSVLDHGPRSRAWPLAYNSTWMEPVDKAPYRSMQQRRRSGDFQPR
jgi:hypothetical protein